LGYKTAKTHYAKPTWKTYLIALVVRAKDYRWSPQKSQQNPSSQPLPENKNHFNQYHQSVPFPI
jgi:hypothetical protein